MKDLFKATPELLVHIRKNKELILSIHHEQWENSPILQNIVQSLKAREKQILLLFGELGAGKTTVAKKIIKSLLPSTEQNLIISSPTFNLMLEYDLEKATLFHLDLYRIRSEDELIELGLWERIADKGIALIEWPQIIIPEIIQNYLKQTLFLEIDYPQGSAERENYRLVRRTDYLFE